MLHIAFDPTSGSVEGSIGMQRSVHNLRRERPVKKLACRLTIASPLPALFATFTLQDQGQPAYRQDRILFKPSLTRITSFCATLGTTVLRTRPQLRNLQVVQIDRSDASAELFKGNSFAF